MLRHPEGLGVLEIMGLGSMSLGIRGLGVRGLGIWGFRD